MDFKTSIDKEDDRKLHIVMFPYLAFGHMIPFLELAKLIAQKGHYISFVSTPRNIDRLPNVPPNLTFLLKFVKLTLPREENLPSDAEATTDIPFHKHQYLKDAYDKLQDDLACFLETCRPDWVIYDFAPYWLPSIASRLGISCAYFSTLTAWTLCHFGSSTAALINGDDNRTTVEDFVVPPKWIPFPTSLALSLYEAKRIVGSLQFKSAAVSDLYRVGSAIEGCNVFAVRSCMEIEPEWLNLLGKLHGKPVIPVGLLPPIPLQNNTRDDPHNDEWLTIISKWLETQNKSSVVYVALGSEVQLNAEDVAELAFGLELSGLPFFWTLRTQQGTVELPDGFEDRTKGRGMVWKTWADQTRILAHESVGCFLTHCGWSSIIESLQFGCPLVLLPFYLDQGLNASVFAEKRVGIQIPRSAQDGSFTRSSVADSLRLMMMHDQRHIYAENANKMQKVFGDKGLHDQYIDYFVNYLCREPREGNKCQQSL